MDNWYWRSPKSQDVWSARRHLEFEETQTLCSSFFGLLFQTTICAIKSSSLGPQRRDTMRMTLGRRDQFRIIAVVSAFLRVSEEMIRAEALFVEESER